MALAAVPPELRAEPVLNKYRFGGYLIWSHVRPFMDGRADMYGDAMLGLYRKLAAGDPATVEETLARYRIAWTIFAPDAGIVATLDRARPARGASTRTGSRSCTCGTARRPAPKD